MGARDACVFSRVCKVVVLNHKDVLLGRNLAGGVLRGPVPAARRDDAEKSQPEALRQQVVDNGVHGRAQVEENTWQNKKKGERDLISGWNKARRGKSRHCQCCSTRAGWQHIWTASTQAEAEAHLDKASSGPAVYREGRAVGSMSCSPLSPAVQDPAPFSCTNLPPALIPQRDLHGWCPVRAARR